MCVCMCMQECVYVIVCVCGLVTAVFQQCHAPCNLITASVRLKATLLHTCLMNMAVVSVMDRALFPDEDTDTDVSGMSTSEKHKYFQEIERIRNELAGFQPIDGPRTESQDPGSPEMAELAKSIR